MSASVTSGTGQQTGCDLGKRFKITERCHAPITPADLRGRDLILNSRRSPRKVTRGRGGAGFVAQTMCSRAMSDVREAYRRSRQIRT